MVSNLGVPFRTIGLVGRPRSSKIKLYLVNKAKIGPSTKSFGFSSGFLVMQIQKNIANHGVPFRTNNLVEGPRSFLI